MRTTSLLKRFMAAGAMLAAAATFQVADAPEASAANYGTVKACQDIHLQGTCQTFTDHVRDLTGSSVGNDKISSVRVEGGTRVVLWEHAGFTGRCTVIDTMNGVAITDGSLVGSVVGHDQVSSISFGYANGCTNPKAWARLSSGSSSDHLFVDVRDLTATDIGNDAAIWMATGDEPVAVYSDINFEGTCETIAPNAPGLVMSSTYVGSQRASSIAIGHRCEDDVRLCEDADFEGRCVSFTSRKPRLSATDLGNDTASSLHVPDGWKVTLYEDDNYQGLAGFAPNPLVLIAMGYGPDGGWGDISENFPVEGLANDRASSIRVEAPSNCIAKTDPRCVGFIFAGLPYWL